LDLSEQQLLDCTTGQGIFRCEGNWPEDVYNYQMSTGQGSEGSYSYKGTVGTCKTTTPVMGKVKGFFKAPPEDENTLKEWIGLYGVASGVIQVDDPFISYHEGIYNTPCNNTRYDHSILIVGYGKDPASNQDYWIVKNSWGTEWGEKGFFRLARNEGNLCRIASYAFLPQA
jgi:cathepsin L